jgi:hypothetical protein
VRHNACGHDATDRDCGRVQIVQEGATGHPNARLSHVDLHLVEIREVEHDATVARGESREAMSTSANREREPSVARYRDCMLNVLHDGRTDHRQWEAIERTVPDPASAVVVGIVHADDLTLE